MRAVVIGAGAVGSRVSRQLLSSGVNELTLVGKGTLEARNVATSLGDGVNLTRWSPAVLHNSDVVVIATPFDHSIYASEAIERGVNVVSVSDSPDDVKALVKLDEKAKANELVVAIGAGMMPGLSCLLAKHGSKAFGELHEIHVAKYGTGGPACARMHHRALGSSATDWRDGDWETGPGGSGRELCWFPDPIGGADCYRGSLPDPFLLQRAFPDIFRITARMAATRRDRLTSRFPMMRKPHPEGLVGGIRVELRGTINGLFDTHVFGAVDRAAVATASVATVAAMWIGQGKIEKGVGGIAELVEDTGSFLNDLSHHGTKVARFVGAE